MIIAVRPTGLRLSKLSMKADNSKVLAAMAPFVAASPAFASVDVRNANYLVIVEYSSIKITGFDNFYAI